MTPKTGPEPLAQPSGALVSLRITGSQAAKIGLLDRWVTARKKTLSRQRNRSEVKHTLHDTVQRLLDRAEQESWSQRQLAKKANLSWGAWRRCRDGQADAKTWLPKLEAALANLKAS